MHIHAVTVNLTKDGRLSAKEIIGSKKEMQQRQDRYSEAMKPFDLREDYATPEFHTKVLESITPEWKNL